jgi:hypothetical protein
MTFEGQTMEKMIMQLIEESADCYYLQWDQEPRAESPAFTISAPYAVGGSSGVWTLRMAGMTIDTFSSQTKAEKHLRELFLNRTNKENGKLLKKHSKGFKLIASKTCTIQKSESVV